MKESALVRKIIAKVREKHPEAIVRKLSDRFSRGFPDIVIYLCQTGALRVLEVECKTPDGRMSRLQEHEQETVNALGQKAGCQLRSITARSVEEVLSELEA